MAVDDSNTKSLLHFDGADGSPIFTDESGKTWTRVGDAQIDTAQYKFGGASGLFDGTGDYIYSGPNVDWNVGSGDFTDEFWFYLNSGGTNRGLVSTSLDRQWYVLNINPSNQLIFYASNNGLDWNISNGVTGGSIGTGSFHHIAIEHYGGHLKVYDQGSAVIDITTSAAIYGPDGNVCLGGWIPAGVYLAGWMDEFRHSKGIARYKGNFTPPTRGFYPPDNAVPPMWFF